MKRQIRHEEAANASRAKFENARQVLRGDMVLSYPLGE